MKTSLVRSLSALLTCSLALAVASTPTEARACGCTTPPIPEPDALDFAVNQSAEQIIFEVDADSVSAHVLIRYAGSPDEFAWLVPVPSVPELALSETYAFGILDKATEPRVGASWNNACPVQQYVCRYHPDPYCGDGGTDSGGFTSGDSGWGSDSASTTDGSGGTDSATGGGEPPPGVDVLDEGVIGDYETVTFAADDAALAVQWLQDNGFIVNDTISPYMQSYIDEQMVFVAAKLVAGAESDAIRPLRITYPGQVPMIPLRLTAVAAEPHMTVTTWIFGDTPYQARSMPDIMIDPADISLDDQGRTNYPMLLARTIDDAGGRGFVREYHAQTFTLPDGNSECCGGSDWCGIADDTLCQCPASDFDLDDCGSTPGLLEGRALLQDIMNRNAMVTRLTTRLSPEEMTFDPEFEPSPPVAQGGALSLNGIRNDLSACEQDILDTPAYDAVEVAADCATTYCGKGTCVATDGGPACDCDDGYVARQFLDLDGESSVTCVPATSDVDLGKDLGGLPDVCANVSCGDGTCVNLNGFPACQCDEGTAARLSFGAQEYPACWTITRPGNGPGGKNATETVPDLDVCAVPPPSCGADGWLEESNWPGPKGVACPGNQPNPDDFIVPPEPTCPDGDSGSSGGATGGEENARLTGCGCTTDDPGSPWWMLTPLLLGLGRIRRRR